MKLAGLLLQAYLQSSDTHRSALLRDSGSPSLFFKARSTETGSQLNGRLPHPVCAQLILNFNCRAIKVYLGLLPNQASWHENALA